MTLSADSSKLDWARVDSSLPETDPRRRIHLVRRPVMGRASDLLEHMVLEDLRHGHPLAVLDLRGKIHEEVILELVPPVSLTKKRYGNRHRRGSLAVTPPTRRQ